MKFIVKFETLRLLRLKTIYLTRKYPLLLCNEIKNEWSRKVSFKINCMIFVLNYLSVLPGISKDKIIYIYNLMVCFVNLFKITRFSSLYSFVSIVCDLFLCSCVICSMLRVTDKT